MLGKLPCVPRTASSRSLLIPCEDSDGDAAGFSNGPQVTALQSPCKVVVGFDVEAEKPAHLANVCESPRSVLESPAALSLQEKQVAPSPRSGLWSLLAAKAGSDEDADGIPPSPAAANVLPQACDCGKEAGSVCVCKETSILHAKNSHCDLSSNACECNKHGLHFAFQEDLKNELLNVDIFPTRIKESSSGLNSLEEAKSGLKASPTFPVSNSVKIDNEVTNGPLECQCGHGIPDTNLPTSALAGCLSEDPVRKDLYAPDWTSLVNSVGKGSCDADLDPRHGFHYSDIDVGYDIPQPFFVASSPYSPKRFTMPALGFLKICNYCGCFLNLGKDIFMYRGDQTFCSAECRYRKIALDERI